MMFSRQDLGRLFKEDEDEGNQGKDSRAPLPVFRPLKETEKRAQRYWAGKAPDWVPPETLSSSAPAPNYQSVASASHISIHRREGSGEHERAVADAEIVFDATDASVDRRRTVRRTVHDAEVVGQGGNSSAQAAEEEEDAEAIAERRRKLRERLARRGRSPPPVKEGSETSAAAASEPSGDVMYDATEGDDGSTREAQGASAPSDVLLFDATDDGADSIAYIAPRDRVEGDAPDPPQSSLSMATSADVAGGAVERGNDDVATRRARLRDKLRARASADREEPGGGEHRAMVNFSLDAPSSFSSSSAAPRSIVEALIAQQQDKAGGASGKGDDSDDEKHSQEEDSDEDNEDDEEDDNAEGWANPSGRRLFRPVFRSRDQRETLRQAEEQAAAEEAAAAAAKQVADLERQEESRALVSAQLAREAAESAAAADANAQEDSKGKPDDSDRKDDEEAEFQAWRLRELKRLQREHDARLAIAQEAADTARRRTLTPEQLAAEDAELARAGIKVFHKEKAKWSFMQKYYHRGAFYVDEESVADKSKDVRARPADAPAEHEKIDKSLLPKVLQVKDFGKRGRTKYTHLAAEDTTAFDDYHRLHPDILSKVNSKLAAVHHGGGLNQKR